LTLPYKVTKIVGQAQSHTNQTQTTTNKKNMLLSIISDHIFAVNTLVEFGGKREIEPAQLVQGSLSYNANGIAVIYPKFVMDLPQDLDPSAEASTSVVGRVSFKYSKEVGNKGGVTFNVSVAMRNAPKGYLSINCIAFDKTPKLLQKYADGRNVVLNGKLTPKSYVNKEGDEVLSWSLLVQDFQFISGPGTGSDPVADVPASTSSGNASSSYDDDIAF
jgi:single-stranded DNA-binding protein